MESLLRGHHRVRLTVITKIYIFFSRLDLFGNVEGISFNNMVRDSFINAPVDLVCKSYEAFYLLHQTLHHQDNLFEYKMQPGDIACFNNRRVLHGRTGYNPTTTNRWLQGCYFDWDEMLSKYRTLKKKVSRDQ